LKSLTLLVRVKGMKKIDDKKIKGISIELDRSTKLNELDDTINEFREKTDDKHEIYVSVDIQNATLHMKRVKRPYITLAAKDGEIVKKSEEIDIKVKDD
jgi:hypothetical protein